MPAVKSIVCTRCLRAFCVVAWRRSGRGRLAAEHSRCAQYFLQHSAWDQAVRHLLVQVSSKRAAGVIAEHGHEWIAVRQTCFARFTR